MIWCVYISCHLSIIIVMYSLILKMCSIWKVVSQTHAHTFILVVPHNMGHFEIINKSWMSLDYTIFSFRHMEWFITVLSLKVKQGYFFIILAYTTLEFNILKHWYLCYRKKKINFDNIPLSLPNFMFHWFYLFVFLYTVNSSNTKYKQSFQSSEWKHLFTALKNSICLITIFQK